MHFVSDAVHSVLFDPPCLALLAAPLRDHLRQFPNDDGVINVRGNHPAIEPDHSVGQRFVGELLCSRRRDVEP